jgi:hypothetical protein
LLSNVVGLTTQHPRRGEGGRAEGRRMGEEGGSRKEARAARDLSRVTSTQAQAQSTYLALVAAAALLPWMMVAPVGRGRRGRSKACMGVDDEVK